jgi:hypothetical protein
MADDDFTPRGLTPKFQSEKRELADIYAISDRMSFFEGWVARYKIRSAGRLIREARGVLEELAALDDAFAGGADARRRRAIAAARLKRVDEEIRRDELIDARDDLLAKEGLAAAEHNHFMQTARRRKERERIEREDAGEAETPGKAEIRRLAEKRHAIAELREWLAGERAREVRRAGGKEKLTEEQEKALDDLAMHVEDAIRRLWEE